jgi:uncharacterized repeat protein (TIGR01451 family)
MTYLQNGDLFYYNIVVSNESPYTDTNVTTVINALPAGITYSHVALTQGAYNPTTRTWLIPTLPGRTTTSLKLYVTVADIAQGPFTITGATTGTLVDPNLVDNSFTLTASPSSCTPDAGGVADLTSCLCIDVAANDTECTFGTSEWRLDTLSVVNGVLQYWDELTGKGGLTPIDPTLPITGKYSLWCVLGVDEFQKSCAVDFTIYPQLDNKDIFNHTISTVPFVELSVEDAAVVAAQYPGLLLSDYCWRILRNANGEATSGEPVDCNEAQDVKFMQFCSEEECSAIVNNCPTCLQNQLPADVALLVAGISEYEPEVGDTVMVQHPNAVSYYEYQELGWFRSTCGCVFKVSQDVDNLLTLGTDNAPFMAAPPDELLKVTTNDTTPNYLLSKVFAGTNVTITLQNPGGNEHIILSANDMKVIENNIAGIALPNIISVTEKGKLFTNTGATALNYHTLPPASPGNTFLFAVTDANGIIVKAAAGDDINIGGILSTVEGTIMSTVIGSTVYLVAVDTTTWVAISITGTWTAA